MKKRVPSCIAAILPLVVASAAAAQPSLPAGIAAQGEPVIGTLHGVGAQIYECKADGAGKLAWSFREPVATLVMGGKTVGHHYPGPTWELLDGSAVVGKAVARAPGATAGDIPWLRLEIVSRKGKGQLDAVTTIQRINTRGGIASGGCEAVGGLLSVPYASDYIFLKN